LVPKQERARVLRLVALLKSEAMRLGRGKMTVTQREIDTLKPDIEYIESVLARNRAKADDA
jgi:hypothetical protein